MQLNPLAFNQMLNNIGQRFEWRKAYACPCVNPANLSPRPDCPQCRGKGTIWAAPVVGIAGVPSQSAQRKFSQQTQWEDGDMVLTVPSDSPLYNIGENDRVLQLNGSDPFAINLRYRVKDLLPWRAIVIERVFWLDGQGAIVEGGIPVQQADGTLVFSDGAPPSGAMYSVNGKKYSEYFLFKNFPGDRGHHFGAALPLRCQLRRFDLFGR